MFENRTQKLNNKAPNLNAKYIAYIMEASQRCNYNYALEFSIWYANKLKKPLIVFFPLTDNYKWSNQRYYTFMLQGIIELRKNLKDRGIKLIIYRGSYLETSSFVSKNAVALIVDKSYLKNQRLWRKNTAKLSEIEVIEVESEVIIPVETVSNKKEPYFATFKPKYLRILSNFLETIPQIEIIQNSNNIEIEDWQEENSQKYINQLKIDKEISQVSEYFKGGWREAEKKLNLFLQKKFDKYKENRNNPSLNYQTDLSPYIHFGQISTQYIILKTMEISSLNDPNFETLLYEMAIWRELARNYCYYNFDYNNFEGLPNWAKVTLLTHQKDKREYIYTIEEFENAKTHDKYWNTAQKELLLTGKMHNYMRMYWAKKIIEWTETPKFAFDIACYLNDKYQLDGRDPNGYAGISWCFGTHDRPWFERPIFGKIRYMNDKGLDRKFDMKDYIKKILPNE